MGETHVPDVPEDDFEDSQDDTGTDGPIEELVPEKDEVSGGTVQEPAWPAPNREDNGDQRILNRVKNLRNMATTNDSIANHLKALGLDE